ncbi:MAG: acyltransferase [Alistipes sp.]
MIERIKQYPQLKRFVLWLISSERHPRPRLWVRWFLTPCIHKRGKGARVYRHARLDIFPWHRFELGARSQIEDYAVVNNGVGDVLIGEDVHIGIGSVVVGPVQLGRHAGLGQYVSVQGMNHGFADVTIDSDLQPLDLRPVVIGDCSHVGTNSTVVAGVTIGDHCMIGAGSVVTKNIPSYSVALGNPARVVKRYDFERQMWVKVN